MEESGTPRERVEGIALPEVVARPAPPAQEQVSAAGGDSAQINAGALLAFDAGTSAQQRADISNSVLFAQLAADAQSDRFVEPDAWSRTCSTVLGAVGWALEHVDVRSPVRLDPPVDWAQTVAAAFPGSPGQELAAVAMKAAGRLTAESEALSIWHDNGAQGVQGNFFVQSAWVANDDLLSGSVQVVYQLVRQADGFLSWITYFEVTTSATVMTLNEDVYKQVRSQIVAKLGDRPRYLTAPVPL